MIMVISWIGETQITGSFTVDLSDIEVEPGKIILSFTFYYTLEDTPKHRQWRNLD